MDKFYRVKSMPMRQALGLAKVKGNQLPDLETVLNRMFAQGYACIGIFGGEGAVTAVLEKRFEVETEQTNSAREDAAPPKADNVTTLRDPEIMDKSTGQAG